MDAVPPPPPNEDQTKLGAALQAESHERAESPSEFPSARDTSIHERNTLAGRWETLNRQLSRLPVIMMLASLLLGLGIVQLTFQIGNSIYRSVTWKQETQVTMKRVRELQQDVNILKDAERMALDPGYLEQLARCQGFVRNSERVVIATNAPTNPGDNCSAVRLP